MLLPRIAREHFVHNPRIRMSTRRAALAASPLFVACLLLGCSSDDDGDAADASLDTQSEGSHPPDASPTDTGAGDASDANDTADTSEADSAPPVDAAPALRFIGRFNESTSPPTSEWSGSAVEARFNGSSVSIHLGGTNTHYYAVLVDGVLQQTLVANGDKTFPIATGLSQGEHRVVVFRRDEANFDVSKTYAFDFGDGGALLAPPPAPARKIEIIGDSISCGYGIECAKSSDGFTQATENEYIAYGPLTARALNADLHVVAWSGKGMYRNVDGSTTETMPTLWKRTIPTDKTSTWDASKWIPDAVVINLGTNDMNGAPAGIATQFEATYLEFVKTVRGAYPDAFIFGSVGPMLGGTGYTTVKTAITNVIAARKSAGDSKMALVEFPTQSCGADGTGCGCGSHPNAAEHQKMSTLLQAAMKQSLGW